MCFIKKLGSKKLFGKNELERLGTSGHPMIIPVCHHLLAYGINIKETCLNRNEAFTTLNN